MIAGADRRNASAAAAGAPRATSRPAIGTDPHSHPGRATPAAAATGHGEHRALRAAAADDRAGRHERRDRGADPHPQHQERQRLDEDGDEQRRPMADGGPVEHVLEQWPEDRPRP